MAEADPCYNGPIRLKREKEGLTIYSVGRDGKDDGGKIVARWETTGADCGFQLWDMAGRPKRSIMGK